MKLLRIVMAGVIGYFIGFQLAECTKSYGQAKQNDQIRLTTDNTVLLRGVVDQDSIQTAQLEIVRLAAIRLFRSYPIYLVLDSPGGDVDAGIQFIEFAKTVYNLKTVTIFSASMAANIAESLPGERLITDNGQLMFHRAKGQFSGQFEMGEVESRLASAKTMILKLEQVNADRMGLTLADYKNKVKDEMWLDAAASLKGKAADRVVDLVCSKDLVDVRIKSSF